MTSTFALRNIRNLALLAVVAVVGFAADEQASKPFSRERATVIIANARKIVTPNGIERLEKVRIGGIDQWVSIRGADKRNPVLLLIHGGPGYVSLPLSWWFTRGHRRDSDRDLARDRGPGRGSRPGSSTRATSNSMCCLTWAPFPSTGCVSRISNAGTSPSGRRVWLPRPSGRRTTSFGPL